MIITVKKYLFYGLKHDLDRFFEKAQEAGFIEFIGKGSGRVKEIPLIIKDLIGAIRTLKKEPVILPPVKTQVFNVSAICEEVLSARQAREKAHERIRLLKAEIERVSPFGDFQKEDVDFLRTEGKRYLQFFCIKSSKAREIKCPEELLYISSANDLDYFVSVSKELLRFPKFIEMQIEKPLHELKAEFLKTEKDLRDLDSDLRAKTVYLPALRDKLIEQTNFHHLHAARESANFPMEDSLFAIEAWVPKSKEKELLALVRTMTIDYELIAIEKQDRVPTYMENGPIAKMGEDLVNVYDVPSIKDKDPSSWVLTFFTIFFAMIISDAGYGLVFLALALFFKFKTKNLQPMARRMINLGVLLSSACIVWGIFTGSFFGVGVTPENPLSRATVLNYLTEKKAEYHVKQQDDVFVSWQAKYPRISNKASGKDFLLAAAKLDAGDKSFEAWDAFQKNILLEFALLAGIIHICLGLLRYAFRNFAAIGWVIYVIGGYLYLPSHMQATSLVNIFEIISKPVAYQYGFYLTVGGISLAMLGAFIQRGISAMAELPVALQIFGDVMSYLRLYALGLAGMIMGATFNEMGLNQSIIIAPLVIIGGHLTNILMSLVGGVVHGLRLNFIEWYHYCLEGDGKLFNPLKLLK